jgi:hypothetical protein
MDVWTTRADAVEPDQQEELRWAILTAVLYLNELYEQGNRSGAFAHQEPGRAALDPSCDQVLTTRFAMYGLSSFAEKGAAVDPQLARDAFFRAREAWTWLDEHARNRRDSALDSIVAVRLARAAQRLGVRTGVRAGEWFDRAKVAAAAVLTQFGGSGDRIAKELRPTQRSIPWFEGVHEVFFREQSELTREQSDELKRIADQLRELTNNSANGFCLLPQADYEWNRPQPGLPERNWTNLADLPLAVKPIPEPPVGDWYLSTHFATAAADCVYIGRLTGDREFERLATSNLYWMLGLNPGIPTTKVAEPAPTDGPWSAASFVYNGRGAFARTIEGLRTTADAMKPWLARWEVSLSSRHRESWPIHPAENGFQSIVNGHVLRESQWHYWSVGKAGWVSAETFLLIDASFLRAALALEDWHSGSTLVRATPYDVTKFRFFDTTHLDRANTRLWRFDDPDRTPAAHASRMATDFAGRRGFGGARLTGHCVGECVGVLCLPLPGTVFEEVAFSEIATTEYPFSDIDTAKWAQVARAAVEIAARRHKEAGFFTGHQDLGRHTCSWVGIDAALVEKFDIDDNDALVTGSQWKFPDINEVGWAQAARLATDICRDRRFNEPVERFAGGFFTGHQDGHRRQIAALLIRPR